MEANPQTKKNNLKWPIVLMAWPAIALIGSFILYAIIGFMTTSAGSDGSSTISLIKTVVNITLFLVGVASVLMGPISFIIGLVLFIQRYPKK